MKIKSYPNGTSSKSLWSWKVAINFKENEKFTLKVFTVEKIFPMDAILNYWKLWYRYELSIDFKSTYPIEFLDLDFVFSTGKYGLTIIQVWRKAESWCLRQVYKVPRFEWLKEYYWEESYVSCQDTDPGHTTKKLRIFCKAKLVNFSLVELWPLL